MNQFDKSQSVAEFMPERSVQLSLCNWAFYMLGIDRCKAFASCNMTQDQDKEMHRRAWEMFDAWTDWQADIAEGSR
jgi:hypothetical protein